MRDWTNKTFLHVAEVNVEIAAAGWSPRFGHVLCKDVARADSFNEYSAEVSDQWRYEVVRLESVGSPHRRRFLPKRTKYPTNNLCLPVEIHETLFHEASELQITIEFEMLLGFERGFSHTAQRLSFDKLAWSMFRADSHFYM